MSKGGGGGANVTELQKEIEMLKKFIADKDVELAACREQLNSKEDAMNRLEAEVSPDARSCIPPRLRPPTPTSPRR
jgi:hypothetical protein